MKKEYIRSLLVMVCICLGMGLLLAVVYKITQPVIEKNDAQKTEQLMKEMFPTAKEFTLLFDQKTKPEDAPKTLMSLYQTENGDYVATVKTQTGYGASVFMLGINKSSHQTVALQTIAYADSVYVGDDYLNSYQNQSKELPDVVSSASPAKYTREAIRGAVEDVFRYVENLESKEAAQ